MVLYLIVFNTYIYIIYLYISSVRQAHKYSYKHTNKHHTSKTFDCRWAIYRVSLWRKAPFPNLCEKRANLCEKVSPQVTCCAQRANLCEKVSLQVTCCAQRANLCEKVSLQVTCCAQRPNLCEKVSPQVTCCAQRPNLCEKVSPPQIFAKRCYLLISSLCQKVSPAVQRACSAKSLPCIWKNA